MANGNGGRPSFRTVVGEAIRAPFERRALEAEHARYERIALEAATAFMNESVRYVQPEDDGFTELLSGAASSRKLDSASAQQLRKQAIRAAFRSPLLGGYLKTMKRFVIGRGPVFEPQVEEVRLKARMKAWWQRFEEINLWNDVEDEYVSRTWRDGETFVRRFAQDRDGQLGYTLTREQQVALAKMEGFRTADLKGMTAPKGMTLLRLYDPDQIVDPSGIFTEGIVTSNDDVRNVLGYCWTLPDKREPTFVPANEMMHTKVGVDLDIKRGRSLLEILLIRDRQYEDWVRYRIALSLYRSAVVLIRKLAAGSTRAGAQSIRDAQAAQRNDSSNDARTRMFKPGTTITTTPGIEYEFKTPNLQANDAQHDGRMLQLNMAAATGLPEYMFSGDSANANYASTLVSEGPAFREFESWQDFFTPRHRRIYRWVFEDAIAAGAIEGLTREAFDRIEIAVTWPNIEVRDELKHTQANKAKHDGRILSLHSWAADESLDYEKERKMLDQEMQDSIERLGQMPTPPPNPQGGGAGGGPGTLPAGGPGQGGPPTGPGGGAPADGGNAGGGAG